MLGRRNERITDPAAGTQFDKLGLVGGQPLVSQHFDVREDGPRYCVIEGRRQAVYVASGPFPFGDQRRPLTAFPRGPGR